MANITDDGTKHHLHLELNPIEKKKTVFRKVKAKIELPELPEPLPMSPSDHLIITHSRRVRAADFSEPWFIERSKELNFGFPLVLHRKLWEFAVITQVYRDRIAGGGRVLGFGCGIEPLPAYFAGQCASVVATDYTSDAWRSANQQSRSRDDLPYVGVCDREQMAYQVEFREVDMRDIPIDLRSGEFDFVWSSSSMEHLGSLQAGIDFVCSAMECLRAGGVAVHTTEFAYESRASTKFKTLESTDLSLYRGLDLVTLGVRLENQGDRYLSPDNWTLKLADADGSHPADSYVDHYPYNGSPEGWHLNLDIAGWKSTSVALVAIRGGV